MGSLHLFGGSGLVAFGLHLRNLLRHHDQVPAELRLDRIGDLARLQREGNLLKLGHHLPLGELAKIAALLLRWAARLLLRHLSELRGQFLRRHLVKLSLQLLDLLLGVCRSLCCCCCVRGDVGDCLCDFRRIKLNLVLDLLLEKTLYHNYVLERLLCLILAKRILLGKLLKVLRCARLSGTLLDYLIFLFLDILRCHLVETLLFRLAEQKRLHEELLRKLLLKHLLGLFLLISLNVRLAGLHQRSDILVERTASKRLTIDRDQRLVLFAATCNARRRQRRSANNLNVHSRFLLNLIEMDTFSA